MRRFVFVFLVGVFLVGFGSSLAAIPIDYSGFESGEQGWADGGTDSDRSSLQDYLDDSGVVGGSFSWHIQDDTTTSYTEKAFDFRGYEYVNLSFSYYADNINPGEYIQVLCDGTELWRWTEGDTLQDTWIDASILVYPDNCTFDSSVTIRLEGDPGLSGNGDEFYWDGVNLTGYVSAWAGSNSDKCRSITVGNVGASALTDFPAYINLTYDSDMQADYSDLRFYDASCGNYGSLMDYEIENYTGTSAHIWARIPTLSAAGTVISVYYGNGTAVNSGENPTGVWDENYFGVWHFKEGSGTSVDDSTSNDYDGTLTQSDNWNTIDAMISNSYSFDGGDYMIIDAGLDTDLFSELTVEAYVNADTTGRYDMIVGRTYDDNWVDGWGLNFDPAGTLDFWVNDYASGDTSISFTDTTNNHFVTGTYDSSQDVKIYSDGTLQSTLGGISWGHGNGAIQIAKGEGGNYYFDGLIDEVRISNTARSVDWISQSYQIVENQGTYVIIGSETSPPIISNITASHATIKGGDIITIYANTTNHGVNDTEADSLTLYCDTTDIPTASNTECTGGTNSDASYPYVMTCTFATPTTSANNTEFCRVYDGTVYSSVVNLTYTTDSIPPSLTLDSVAGDTSASYYDTVDDGVTEINLTGEVGMLGCRWSTSDIAYSSMSDACILDGTTGSCSVTGLTQGFNTRYVSCQDSLDNGNNATNNLDVSFFLDYTAPTTSDDSFETIIVPDYTVTISEADNVDLDPMTLYCTDTVGTCVPSLGIDHLGTVTFTSANRGVNYLRYNSSDDVGNVQAVANKTININQLPVFTSATDNATTIGGGELVNITSVSSDVDPHDVTIRVCDSTDISSSGCGDTQYCTATGSNNVTCVFAAENDSASHTWYAFLYDALGEIAVANFTGSYTTDSTSPVITISNPLNTTYTDDDVTVSIVLDESGSSAWYNLDGNSTDNVSMVNSSSIAWNKVVYDLSLGGHNITFYANDTYGNVGISSVRYFTIASPPDTTVPTITINSPLNASYQDPDSVLINITVDENLEWAGYSLNGGSVVDMGSVSLTEWNVTLSGLDQEASYNLTVYANDTSSNQNNKTYVFYTDSLAPRYSSAQAYPSPANVSDSVNCSISWNDTFDVTNVKISENSSGVHENHTFDFFGASGVVYYNIVGSKLDDVGGYSCIFYAEDSAGNSDSTSIDFDVNDVTFPIITVTSPNNATYNQLSIDFSLVVSEAASWAGYSLDGAANVTMGNTSTTNWNSTISVSDGNSYMVQFYANDSSGNMANSSEITFGIDVGGSDVVAPVVSVDSIANASYVAATSVELNVSTNENASWVGYVLNGVSLTNLTNSSMVDWNASLSGLGVEATNTLVVYANDSSDNQGNKTVIFYSDSLAPRFSSVGATPSVANETQSVVCSAYVNDSFGLTGVKVEENSSGSFENHTLDLVVAGWMNYTINDVEKGGYTCRFYSIDLAGNANSTSTTYLVNDVIAPVVTINSPLNQSYSLDSILLSVSLDEDAVSVDYSLDGGVSNTTLPGSGTSWSDSVVFSDGLKTVTFYAEDSSGNVGTNSIVFDVDTTVTDVTGPTLTVWSPVNATYDLDGSILLNITSNENLGWAGYTNNSGGLTDLENTSLLSWNASVVLAEGSHEIVFYGNDTSSNQNQGNVSVTVYVDLTAPAVLGLACGDANDSEDVGCVLNVTDAVGLDYVIFSYNATGSWVNSSEIDLSGTSDSVLYGISSGNHSPVGFSVRAYVYDLSGRINGTEIDAVVIGDDTIPTIDDVTYFPNASDDLDAGVAVNVNATVGEDYNISVVYLMYKNSSASDWTYLEMNNNSALVVGSNSSIVYNASFIPQTENWTFKINATDYAENENISDAVTIEVADDVSQDVSSDISSIESLTYAQRTSNNSMGNVVLNNTGDVDLNFSVTIDSSIASRFSVNYTGNQTENYSVGSGSSTSIIVDVNSSELIFGLYAYNVTVVSAAGSEIFERNLNVQTSAGAYLVTTIGTYSSTVIAGQEDVELVATVQNLGTSDATGVYLNWTLPSGFSLSSGSLNRDLGILGIGVSGTNTIMISVSSSAADQTVELVANASSSNADSANDSKSVAIGSGIVTEVVTEVVTIGSGGGSSGGGENDGSKSIVYDKVIEIVRGVDDGFNVEVVNPYSGASLGDLTIELEGFLEQYISFSPEGIDSVVYGEEKSFFVNISAPAYTGYEERDLKVLIKGNIMIGGAASSYREVQNIKLIIQEVSRDDAEGLSKEAKSAIVEMGKKGFDVGNLEGLLVESESWLDKRRNKKSWDLSSKIVETRNVAFEADDLLRRLIEAMQDPKKSNLIVNGVVNRFGGYDVESSLSGLFTGRVVFASEPTENIVDLAIAAFERGDYFSALDRAKEARTLLILERKGNFFLFVYLYWPFLLLAAVSFSVLGVLGFRRYKKVNVANKIKDINKEEKNIGVLLVKLQTQYFGGKVSDLEYARISDQHKKKLANIRKSRVSLRNVRLEMLTPRKVLRELVSEKSDVENEIKKIQRGYYITKNISENDYKTQFEIFNERLAEIEEERTTIQILNSKGVRHVGVAIKKSRVAARKRKLDLKLKKKRVKKVDRDARRLLRKKAKIAKKIKKVVKRAKKARIKGKMHDVNGKKIKSVRRNKK